MPPSEPVVYVNDERTVLVRVWSSGLVEVATRELDVPLPIWGKPTRVVREGQPGEAEYLIAALVSFAPAYSSAVDPFGVAHQRACRWLNARSSSLSPNQIRAAVDVWKEDDARPA